MKKSIKIWLLRNWVKLSVSAVFIGLFLYFLLTSGQTVYAFLLAAGLTFMLFLLLSLVFLLLNVLFTKNGREMSLKEPTPTFSQSQKQKQLDEWNRGHACDELDDDDSCNHPISEDIVKGICFGAGLYMSGCIDASDDCGGGGDSGGAS